MRITATELLERHTDAGLLCFAQTIRPSDTTPRTPIKSASATMPVKMVARRTGQIEGLAIPFGGPFRGGTDADGEFFTKNTDLALKLMPVGARPVLYNHGFDPGLKTDPIGRVEATKTGPLGVWAQAQLDRSSDYFDAIMDLVAAGRLYFSSGSMSHLIQKKASGEITHWPWFELSLTPSPSNLYAEVRPVGEAA